MRKNILSAICLLVLFLAGCQTDKEKELLEAPFTQEQAYNVLEEASATKSTDPSYSLEKALKGLEISESLQYKNGQLKAYSILSSLYTYQFHDLDKAHYYLEQYSHVMKKKETQLDLAWYLYNKGVAYYNEQKYSEALRYLIKSKTLFQENNEAKHLSNALYTLGLVKLETFQYQEAKTFLEKAYKLADKAEYDLIYIGALEQFGNILLWEGEYKTSVKYFEKSVARAIATGDHENAADGLNVIGYNLVRMGQYPAASEKLSEARKYAQLAGSQMQEGNYRLYRGLLEGHMGEHRTGLQFLAKAEEDFAHLEDQAKLLEVYSQMAWHHVRLKETDMAREAIEKGLTYVHAARKIDTDEFFRAAHNLAVMTNNQADLYRYKYEQAELELNRRRKNDITGAMQIEAEHEEALAITSLERDKATLALEQAQVEKINLTRGMVVAFLLLLIVAGASLSIGFVNNFRASNDLRKLSKDFLTNSSEILQKYGSGDRI